MLPLNALSALLAATLSAQLVNAHGVNHHHKRQTTAAGTSAASSPASTSTSAGTPAAAGAAPSGTGTYSVPPLSAITENMPSGPTPTLATTYTPGAQPTYSNAPPLPSKFVFSQGAWPALDVVPPTDSDEVKEWMKELDGQDIPDFKPTVDGSCANDPAAAAQAQERGWWTCGKYVDPNDIVTCPEKYTWGVSFDDGPAPYTPKLLQYLEDHDISATFFVVGSRVISYPDILIAEYMAGHEISVHTWSHHPLTAMTNEQIVAELGWTRKAIQTVLGVTPTTMRAPFGDIDNRVRAISNAMGLRPIIWTTTPGGVSFDTNDWHVPGGEQTGESQFQIFESLLGNASTLDTGFIVLEHDLFEITVDLAVGYTLDAALKHQPPFKLESIGSCLSIPMNDMYQETATTDIVTSNSSTGSNSSTSTGSGTSGTGTGASSEGGNGAAGLHTSMVGVVAAAIAAVVAGAL
ncbi:hypothetical protein C8Q80DRAFT_1113603 [Daedaleopsis nitida]|nr:hypothetical protein C8Q80DRAFT_1113603 [Daedaleopsis nitida]